ncbi:MAG: hypothetical protein ACHP79_12775, partial [Terriglobales bacterium]
MEEQQLQPEPVPVDLPAEPLELTEPNLIPLEAPAPVEDAQEGGGGQVYVAPEPVPSQYCIFRAGRERFCFSVLDVEEVVE